MTEMTPVAQQWAVFENGLQKTSWTPAGYGDEAGWAEVSKRYEFFSVEYRTLVTLSSAQSAIEAERLRFEGDLDKWMKTIGAGISGYQPEAYAVMDAACEELVRLRARAASLEALVEEAKTVLEPFAALCSWLGASDWSMKHRMYAYVSPNADGSDAAQVSLAYFRAALALLDKIGGKDE